VATDEDGTVVAAFIDAGLSVEKEAALDLLGIGAVTLITMLDEDGADFLLEKVEVGRIGGARGGESNADGSQQGAAVHTKMRKNGEHLTFWLYHRRRSAWSKSRGRLALRRHHAIA